MTGEPNAEKKPSPKSKEAGEVLYGRASPRAASQLHMDHPEVLPSNAPGTPLVPSTPPQGDHPSASTPQPVAQPPAESPAHTPAHVHPPATADAAAAQTPAAAPAAAQPSEPAKKPLASVKEVGVAADRNARHRRFMEVCDSRSLGHLESR